VVPKGSHSPITIPRTPQARTLALHLELCHVVRGR
jgi:hypothetical protein